MILPQNHLIDHKLILPRFDRICPNLRLLFELHEIWSLDSQENCGGAAGRLNSVRLEHTPKSPPLGLGPTLRPLGISWGRSVLVA